MPSETSPETKNRFWTLASNAMERLSDKEETMDNLKHWLLHLEGELRQIKNPNTLKSLKRDIMELVYNVDND